MNRSSGTEVRQTLPRVLTAEERSLQKFAIEFHDDAHICCRTPDSIDNEHAPPENPPMGDAQTDEGNHHISLPFPKGNPVR